MDLPAELERYIPRFDTVLFSLAEELLTSERRQKMEEILMTGAEALIEQGIEQGELRSLLRIATRRFGLISDTLRSRISRLPAAQVEELTDAILDLPDQPALEAWLEQKAAVG